MPQEVWDKSLASIGLMESILYIVVLDEDSEFEWVPEELVGSWPMLLATLPRNLYQVISTDNSTFDELLVLKRLHVNCQVIYEENIQLFLREVDTSFFEHFVGCIVCNAKKPDWVALIEISKKFKFCTWTSTLKNNIEHIKSQISKNYFETHEEYLGHLNSFLTKNGFPTRTFVFEKESAPNFKAVAPMLINNKLLENNFSFQLDEYRPEPSDRIALILDLCYQNDQKRNNIGPYPDELLLIAPYKSPAIINSRRRNIREQNDKELRRKAIEYMKAFLAEQDNNYLHTSAQPIDPEVARIASYENTRHSNLLDNMAHLHSSGSLTKVIRLPARSTSLNEFISRASPRQMHNLKDDSKLEELIKGIGEAIYYSYPEELREYLFECERTISVISDLPLEWMFNGTHFLSQISDICRLPEHPPRTLMTHHVLWGMRPYMIDPLITKNTLVVCGSDDPPLMSGFNVIKEFCKSTEARFIRPKGLDDFYSEYKSHKPELLIIFTHGYVDEKKFTSSLQIGNEVLTNNDVKNLSPTPPLVILIACESAPLFGYHNPIAQAFFQYGSCSVTSSMLPISVSRGVSLTCKIINQLSIAAKDGIHYTWCEFLNHMVRSSTFDTYIDRVRFGSGGKIVGTEEGFMAKVHWLTAVMRGHREWAFDNIKEEVSKCFAKDKDSAMKLIKNAKIPPEPLYFTHWGRSDRIIFERWMTQYYRSKSK